MSQILFNEIKQYIVNKSVPSKKVKQIYQMLLDKFPNEMKHYARYPYTDTLYMLQHELVAFRSCKMCGKELQRIPHRTGQQYCGIACYKSDPEGVAKISAIKSKLYSDDNWKRQTELKKIATNVARSGFEHPMQDPVSFELQQKSSWQAYEYKGISGLRGYEKFAVDKLLNQGVKIENISAGTAHITEHSIKLEYIDHFGKRRHYMPDLFVKGTRDFIEVKSDFTLEKGEENNELFYKAKAANAAGYNLLVWVYDTKGNLIVDAVFHSMKHRSIT